MELPIEWLVGAGVGVFLVGGLAGYLLRSFAFGGSRKEADLARALEASEEELANYKQEVLERFSDTADKFRRLNDSYNDLHEQLAESAMALCGDDASTPLLSRAERHEDTPVSVSDVSVELEPEVEPEREDVVPEADAQVPEDEPRPSAADRTTG